MWLPQTKLFLACSSAADLHSLCRACFLQLASLLSPVQPYTLPLHSQILLAGPNDGFNMTVVNSTATCVVYTAPPSSGKSFPWWAGLILGLGLAIILCTAACCLLLCLHRRKRRRQAAGLTKALPQGNQLDMQSVANPMQLASPFNIGPPPKPGLGHQDDSAMMVPKFSSAPGEGIPKPALGLQRQGSTSAPPDVYEANMSNNATHAPVLPSPGSSGSNPGGSNASDSRNLYRRESSGNDRNNSAASASSSLASQCLGRSSGGAPAGSVPELFRQRSHMPLDEVELGPLLGRGAYGRVFKGISCHFIADCVCSASIALAAEGSNMVSCTRDCDSAVMINLSIMSDCCHT